MRPTPTLVRFEIESSKEEDGQLLVSGKGLAGERFKDLLFIQPHGAASRPPAGSIGIASVMPGRRTQSLVVGVEHHEHRPSLPEGASALYDASGNIMKLMAGGVTMDFGSRTVTLTGGQWNIAGPVHITGDLEVTGNIHASGTIIDELGNTNHHSH